MSPFGRCECGGFVLRSRASCPHCDKRRLGEAPRGLGLLGGALGGATIAFTLMACYGLAPCPGGSCKELDSSGGDASDAGSPSDAGTDARDAR